MVNLKAGITGLGIALPNRVITNEKIEKIIGVPEGWVLEKKLGIEERRWVSDNEQVSDLGTKAAFAAIENADIRKEEISYIIAATSSPEHIWPSTACLIQQKLELDNIPAVDIQAVCSGFAYGLDMTSQLIHKYPKILFVCTEALSRFLNPKDEKVFPLFGDGAAAVIIENVKEPFGVLGSLLGADGKGSDLLGIGAGGSKLPSSEIKYHTIKMDGRQVYRFAVSKPKEIAEKILSQFNLTKDDIKFFVLHQANERITREFEQKMGLVGTDKVYSNIANLGNTSSASIPLALHELYQNGRLEKEDLVVTIGFGAGLTWGANLICWNLEKPKGSD